MQKTRRLRGRVIGNSLGWLDTWAPVEVPGAYFDCSAALSGGFSNSFGSIVGLISIFLYSTRLVSCPFCLFLWMYGNVSPSALRQSDRSVCPSNGPVGPMPLYFSRRICPVFGSTYQRSDGIEPPISRIAASTSPIFSVPADVKVTAGSFTCCTT